MDVKQWLDGNRIKITEVPIILQEFFAIVARKLLKRHTYQSHSTNPRQAYYEARQILDIPRLNLPIESILELNVLERRLSFLKSIGFPKDLSTTLYPVAQQMAFGLWVDSALLYVRSAKKAQEDVIEQFRKAHQNYDSSRSLAGNPVSLTWREVLGVSRTEKDLSIIKQAYRKLASKHHPDKGGDADKFKQINDAYQKAKEALE